MLLAVRKLADRATLSNIERGAGNDLDLGRDGHQKAIR